MIKIHDQRRMERLAGRLARLAGLAPRVVYLKGPLGSGKTTLVRAWLRHLGIKGRVRSPTFTLLECYELGGSVIIHADLFRIKGAEEVANTGLLDHWGNSLLLIEWPERGGVATPPADWTITIGFGKSPEQRLVFLS